MKKEVQLTREQLDAINEVDSNLQIVACAGSGKTEVISRRIANILYKKPEIKPENIVAFTFTEKAAASMKKRIEKVNARGESLENMYIGTIHGFCLELLKSHVVQFENVKILDTVKCHHFIQRYYNDCGMRNLEIELNANNIKLFLQCIDKMIEDYDNRINWEDHQQRAFQNYIDCLCSHGYIDFSLMIFETLRQMKENPVVVKHLANIKYLIVDEYQDVNDLQEKLIANIVNAGANICVVGDDDQTIYRFRGSNAENMITFSERYENVRQIRLEKNFRCEIGIVDVADIVISNNTRRIPKTMKSGVTDEHFFVGTIESDSSDEQYDKIASEIQRIYKQNVPYKEIAVLVRKGKHAVQATTILEKRGIPVDSDSAESFFAQEYFEKCVTTLKFLVNVNKVMLYECWRGIVDDEDFNIAFKYIRRCSRGGNISLRTILSEYLERIGFLEPNIYDFKNRRLLVEGILKIVDDYEEIYGDWQLSARVTGFTRFLEQHAADEYKYYSFNPHNPDVDAVQIMTVHKAKGLEFHTVFLPELMEKEFPIGNIGGKKYWHILGGVFEENKGKYQSDIEDERKLFYVAITRAIHNLFFCYHLEKKPMSQFLLEANQSNYLQIPNMAIQIKSNKNNQDTIVREARRKVLDYYGIGAYVSRNSAAWGEFMMWKDATDEEIVKEAQKQGLL